MVINKVKKLRKRYLKYEERVLEERKKKRRFQRDVGKLKLRKDIKKIKGKMKKKFGGRKLGKFSGKRYLKAVGMPSNHRM